MPVREHTSPAAPATLERSPGLWPVRYRLVGLTFALSMLLYVDRVAISTARSPIWTGSPSPFFVVAATLNAAAAILWLGARPDRPIAVSGTRAYE